MKKGFIMLVIFDVFCVMYNAHNSCLICFVKCDDGTCQDRTSPRTRHALHQSDQAKKIHEKGTSEKQTDRQTDRQKPNSAHRAKLVKIEI